MPIRVQGIARNQSSKAMKGVDFDLVMMSGCAILIDDEISYDLSLFSTTDAYLSLKLTRDSCLRIAQPKSIIITVENPTSFIGLDDLFNFPWHLSIYTAGKMSNILLSQLELWSNQGHKIVHFGDYDYVGLLEFSRILSRCSDAKLYLPETIKGLMKNYGNRQLLEKQSVQHEQLTSKISLLDDSEGKLQLIEIYQLIQATGKGLEQEALFL